MYEQCRCSVRLAEKEDLTLIHILLEGSFARLGRLVYRFRYAFIVFSLLLSGVAGFFTSQLKLDAGFNSLLPPDHKIIVELERASKIYGGVGTVTLVLRSENFKKTTSFIEKLVTTLSKHKEIRYIDYKKAVPFFERNVLLYFSIEDLRKIYLRMYRKFDYERQKNNPILLDIGAIADPGFQIDDILEPYRKKYDPENDQAKTIYFHKQEKDKHTFVLLIKPARPSLDFKYSENIVAEIGRVIDSLKPASYHSSITYQFTGRYKKKPDSFKMLASDFQKITLISALGVLLILLIYFRSFFPIALIFAGLLTGIIWALGFSQLKFGQLNIITSFLVAILFGLGIDFGIHMFLRYREERVAGRNPEEAFVTMFAKTGVASFISAVTTAFAFIVLYFSGFRAFQEFGMIAGVGVLFTVLAMLTFMAPSMVVLDLTFKVKLQKVPMSLRLPAVIWSKPWFIMTIVVITITVSIYGMFKLGFDYDFGKVLKYKNLQSYILEEEIDRMFNSSITPSVIIPDSIEHEKKILAAIEKQVKKNKGNNNYRIEKALGLTSFVPAKQEQKLALLRRMRRLVQSNRKYEPLLKKGMIADIGKVERLLNVKTIDISKLPFSVRKNFQGIEQKDKHVILVFPRANLDDGKQILELSEQLSEIKVDGKPIDIGSDSLVFAEILKLISDDGPYILLASFIGVFLLAWLNFIRLSHSLIVLVPVFIGLLFTGGALGISEQKLDFINVLVFPIMVGIGIDSGVHIFHRYLEHRDAIWAVQTTGEAVTLSTMTTFWAFASLILAENAAITGMGIVSVVALFMIFACSLFVLPAIILMAKNKLKDDESDES